MVSFGHCIVCLSLTYGQWLSLWYLLVIVLSVFLWLTANAHSFGIFWPLYCLSFFDLRLMIIPLVSFGHYIFCLSSTYGQWLSLWYLLAIALSVVLRLTANYYPFGIFWPLYCLSFFDLRVMIILWYLHTFFKWQYSHFQRVWCQCVIMYMILKTLFQLQKTVYN